MKTIIFKAVLLSLLSYYACGQGSSSGFNGRVIMTAGDVSIDGVPAAVDSPVKAMSTIVTGKDSFCEIVFNEKNILHILENSAVTLDMKANQKVLKIKSGGLEAVLKKLEGSKESKLPPFVVETTTAVATVRGTVFYVRAIDTNTTSICACNGVVELGNPGVSNTQTVKSAHHTGFAFISGANGLSYSQVLLSYTNQDQMKKLIGHNDKDMEDLAAKIGVTIDWTRPDTGE